jgi:SAM-dependent methyltransferase
VIYDQIKKISKALVPKGILFQYEQEFRFVLYQFYRGINFQCAICNSKLRTFIHLNGGDKLCPRCGSLSRTRRLFEVLNTGFLKKGISVLDFSPSRSIYRVLKNLSSITYASTDISGDFLSDFQYDINEIPVDNNKYDLIICYHILEHIDDDIKAMKELYRVLKKSGTCIIQTPFKAGDIYEDSGITNKIGRLKHFEQEDHVRFYSANGLKNRLERCGFIVEIKEFKDSEQNKFGFNLNEKILICRK